MTKFTHFVRGYFALFLTILVGVLAGLLTLAGWINATQILVSVFALGVALWKSVGMIQAFLRKHFGVDVLAVTAIIATVVVGEYWASLIIVLMFTGGEALEDYAERRAKRELSALLERAPLIAHREEYSSAGAEKGALFATKDVAVTELAVDEVIVVKPGEVVPVDGELLSTEAVLDESSLTGESIPVDKSLGNHVMSGAVNGSGAFRMKVTATSENSQYQLIVALVAEAAESKAPFVRLADRFAVPFTLIAYALAGTAWALSGESSRFAEVLVVATPCPLIIAAPVAFIAGMSRAARHGIIVKNGGTLEQLSRVKTVAFDKTGTLTVGKPELWRVQPAPGFDEKTLLALAASVEQHSSHTIAQSIVTGARTRTLTIPSCEDVQEITACGMKAHINSQNVWVGKFTFIEQNCQGALKADIQPGELAVYVAVDGKFAGVLLLRDDIREDAVHTLEQLSNLGIKHTYMLTGDGAVTAQHVAQQLGVTNFQAECLPLHKVTAVENMPYRPVMMVGDGVNDAPVLAAADVGVAMGARGSTAASESADVVIMLDDLHRVARAIDIGKRTISIALQSIWIGMVLSLGLMFLAAFGWIPAIVGAGFQEIIDVLTILNALRALGGREILTFSPSQTTTLRPVSVSEAA